MKQYLQKTSLRLLLVAFLLSLLPGTMIWGQGSQPSGSGNSEDDPYQISTRAHLEWMAAQVETGTNTFEGKFFKLMNEIDLSSSPWTTPIGSNESTNKYFAGVFDGNGYRITGLTIPATGVNPYRGLFGVVGKNGYSGNAIIIKNLGIEIAESGIHLNPAGNSNVSQIIGGVAGLAQSCEITNCYVTGGGISYTGDLTGQEVYMGGIAGFGYSLTIKNCYATVDITFNGGTMTYQGNKGRVTIGGITGMGKVSNSFYTGQLKSHATSCTDNDFTFNVGGIAGTGYYLETANCLVLSQTIEVTKDGPLGTIYAKAATGTTMSNKNNFVSPETTLNGLTPIYNNDGDGTKWENTTDANPPLSNWLANGSWQANGNYLPILLTTEGQPFHIAPIINRQGQIVTLIHNATELAAINTNATTLAGPYKLANDIDLSGYNSGSWTPIGSSTTPFKGTFDGNGYMIEKLNVDLTYNSVGAQAGLFGVVENGTVENLGVHFVTLKTKGDYANVGGIAGTVNKTTIRNCYAVGGSIITETSFTNNTGGGIIGTGTQSTILNCYSICEISLKSTGYVYGGGIAGSGRNLSVGNCYSICKIKERSGSDAMHEAIAGGIIGNVSGIYNQPAEQSSISNCLALAKEAFDLATEASSPELISGRILGRKGGYSNATLTNNYATPLMPGNWTSIGTDQNDGADWDGKNCTPSEPDAWDIAWDNMTVTSRSITGPKLPKLKTTSGALINGQNDIDKLLYIGIKLTTTTDGNGTVEVKAADGTTYNSGDYIPADTELTITTKPNASYETASLKVSGSDFTSGSSYIAGSDLTTKGIDLSVEATFKLMTTYTVTIDNPISNGSIEVKKPDATTLNSGTNTVEENTLLTITATPASGYQLKQLTADGTPISGNTYTVVGDVTLSAEFEAKSGGDGDGGDGGGSTTPTVYHTVTLSAVEGATTDPIAGKHEVEAWVSFRFYLTLDKEYDQSEPIVTTSRGETITPRSSDGAYIVKYVRNDVEIFIDGIVKNPDPVGNETIETDAVKVWATKGNLHISTVTDQSVQVYNLAGLLVKQADIPVGDTLWQLPSGIYIVRIAETRYKVIL